MEELKKDIFISYKDDVEGHSFAARLCADLEKIGYTVYFNPNEQRAGFFPERLQMALKYCRDFLLIMTQSCLDQLKRHEKIDWVREELLIAKSESKNIIPLLLPGVAMPKDKEEMPEDLRFLPDLDAIMISEPYDRSPLESLFDFFKSKPSPKDVHRDTYNSSEIRSVDEDFKNALNNSSNEQALLELANLYYFGIIGDQQGCQRDFHKAAQVLDELVKNDSEFGCFANSIIAEMYYHGVMPRKAQSYALSLSYHEKAKTISGFSAREAAYLKSRGCGCEFDYDSIVDYYTNAIETGDTVAVIGLAKFYMKYGKYKEAAELYHKARNILPDAEFQLGMLYRDGLLENPPKPDFYKAAFYFQHAISSGKCDPEVYHQLGRLYFTPVGDFEKDFALAEKYFKIAADKGNRKAQYKLGLMYEYGYVQSDIEKAIHYHTLAAAQGDAKSAYHLAMLYSNSEHKNFQEAFKYAEFSAKKGVMEGEFLFAIFLFYGRGCIADEEKAFKYFTRAYEHGMFAAKVYLDKFNN